jgi:NADH-quinone oxidoreductase subunit E
MVQINYDYYEDLTPENFARLIDDLRAGKPVKTGSQIGRSCSEPEGGGDTLKEAALYDGSAIGRGDWQARITRDRAAAAEAARAAEAAKAVAAAAPAAPAPAASAPAAPASVAKAEPAKLEPAKLEPAKASPAPEPVSAASVGDADKPAMLAAARGGKADDLKLIWGVGPKLEAVLHRMGVFHFDQVAAWTTKELAWVDAHLEGFKGRAIRHKWVDQAAKLAAGWRPDSKLGDKPEGI